MTHLFPVPVPRRLARVAPALVLAGVLAVSTGSHAQPPATLDIYWIDVEGGAATLVVTPERESVLMDAGWPRPDRRDADRIQAAMRDAGITELDYVLISHFHRDHVGGLAQLAERVPIGQLVDHGDSVELDREAGRALWQEYLSVSNDRRRIIRPGDKLPLTRIELTFVGAHRQLVDSLEAAPPQPLLRRRRRPAGRPGRERAQSRLPAIARRLPVSEPRRHDAGPRARAGLPREPDRCGRPVAGAAPRRLRRHPRRAGRGAAADRRGRQQRPAQGRHARFIGGRAGHG